LEQGEAFLTAGQGEFAMKRFAEAGRRAIADKNDYAALSLALMIPDICGSLEDPGPGKSQERYERWFKRWAEPKFSPTFVSAAECYQLRCSLIHSGSAEIQRFPSKFVFFDDTSPSNVAQVTISQVEPGGKVVPGKATVLRISYFCKTIYQAAEEWDTSVKDDAAVQAEKAKLLVIRRR
jgi:hypothetical protein